MRFEHSRELKKRYPAGLRVELISMDDPKAPPAGTRGTVTWVDGIGDIGVKWDSGSSLKLIVGVDEFRAVEP